MELTNFTVSSYTNDAWTTVVDVPSTIKSIIVSNVGAGAVTASLRIATLAGAARAVIMPDVAIPADGAYTLDISDLAIGRGDALQVKADEAGLNVIASGLRLVV